MENGATDAQLAYLRQLGANIPPEGLSKREASDLIESSRGGRAPAEARDFALAARFGARVTRFASKSAIFVKIVEHLYYAEQWDLLYRWFVWRIHRVTFDRGQWAGIEDPFDARLDEVVGVLKADEKWTASVRRAAKVSPSGFRWFGEVNGSVGDSERTYAYEQARRLLSEAFPAPVQLAEPAPVARWRNPDRLQVVASSTHQPLNSSDFGEEPEARDRGDRWLLPLGIIVAALALAYLLA